MINWKQLFKKNDFNFFDLISMKDQNLQAEKKEKNQEINSEEKVSFWRSFLEWTRVVVWALVIIIPIRTFLFQPFFVEGSSMEPNFRDGQYLIVREWDYKKTTIKIGGKEFFTVNGDKKLERGEVIVFRYPRKPEEFFIKRIIGLPGEKVEIKNGQVKIYNSENPKGMILDESAYLPNANSKTECQGSYCLFNLKENEYVVLGDNRSHSSDSRAWGILPRDMLVGVISLRAWPPESFQVF